MEKIIKNIRGFTLIELMLVLSIMAIIISLAAPPMGDFLKRYRAEVQRQALFDLIALSRSKAYGHGETFTLCGSADHQSCSGDWARGALLFADTNGDGSRSSDEQIERVMEPLPEGASLAWASFGNKPYLQFRPNGLTRNQSGNFSYCPPDGNGKYGWIIVLNAMGRPYSGRDNDGDGIVENGSGENLSCTAAK
ncbi:GspH/FimT family pseudopilin [Microbulbifer guangxiensis]|uniref:GspH/FimT family pseudopilin n=1 Tax=Microbulbifer guangxiensis TaxID=2904249 RepID=UPI001F012C3A|nr:GspH/FimT family pseudopilin [Microbulbifer guangxiensis]